VPSGPERTALCSRLGIDDAMNKWTKEDAVAVVNAVADTCSTIPPME
jgi:hypothetical protein